MASAKTHLLQASVTSLDNFTTEALSKVNAEALNINGQVRPLRLTRSPLLFYQSTTATQPVSLANLKTIAQGNPRNIWLSSTPRDQLDWIFDVRLTTQLTIQMIRSPLGQFDVELTKRLVILWSLQNHMHSSIAIIATDIDVNVLNDFMTRFGQFNANNFNLIPREGVLTQKEPVSEYHDNSWTTKQLFTETRQWMYHICKEERFSVQIDREQKGQWQELPADFSGWASHEGIVAGTTYYVLHLVSGKLTCM